MTASSEVVAERRYGRLLILILVFISALSAFGKKEKQERAAPSSPSPVLLPTVVTDASGRSVLGLQQSDFTVEENGKTQALSSFRDVVAKRGMATTYKPQFGEYGNTFDSGISAGTTILVLDTVHTRFADESNVRQQCLTALRRMAEENQPGWLLTNSMNGLHVFHDFRLSPEQTIQAIDLAEQEAAKTTTSGTKRTSEDSAVIADAERLVSFLRGADSNPTPAMSPLRLMPVRTFNAMGQLAQASSGLSGRKSLVWMVESLPISVNVKDGKLLILQNITTGASLNGQSMPAGESSMSDKEEKAFNDLWRDTLASLGEANLAVYPAIIGGQGPQATGPMGISQNIQGGLSSTQGIDTRAAALSLAEITGGRAVLMPNDITTFVTTAAKDSAHYYLLGYLQDNKSAYRRISVKARNAAKQFAPAGAVGWPNAEEKDNWERQNLINALTSPIDYAGVQFTAAVKGMEASGDKKKVSLRITLPPDTDTIDEAQSSVNVDVVLAAYDVAGKESAKTVDRAGGQFTPDVLQRLRQAGLGISRELELSPGEYHVKIAIKNNSNGHIGTVAVPVSVK